MKTQVKSKECIFGLQGHTVEYNEKRRRFLVYSLIFVFPDAENVVI